MIFSKETLDEAAQVPRIDLVPPGTKRPLWSVMIPTYNSGEFLRDTLQSVLAQDRGPDVMQIEVIDDCSTTDDPRAVTEELGKGRVSYFRNPSNSGAIRTFNTCIQRSRGELVHILHGDDTVARGYYDKIDEAARAQPNLGLYAARCFFIDEDSVITGVTGHPKTLGVEDFFDITPIQFAGITVRRSAYEALGGFRVELVHTADREMWTRVVASFGGTVLPDVLANYRRFARNDTSRLLRMGENVLDLARLFDLYAKRYPEFPVERAQKGLYWLAWSQHIRFKTLGDPAAAEANYRVWCQLVPVRQQVLWKVGRLAKSIGRSARKSLGLG